MFTVTVNEKVLAGTTNSSPSMVTPLSRSSFVKAAIAYSLSEVVVSRIENLYRSSVGNPTEKVTRCGTAMLPPSGDPSKSLTVMKNEGGGGGSGSGSGIFTSGTRGWSLIPMPTFGLRCTIVIRPRPFQTSHTRACVWSRCGDRGGF